MRMKTVDAQVVDRSDGRESCFCLVTSSPLSSHRTAMYHTDERGGFIE
jgi:hypothetical protein